MSMFETVGKEFSSTRKPGALVKLERMRKALRHEEPDRVPVSDFFWGGFIRRWREELGLPADANPYYYYDLDWICTVPNMDPWIRSFEVLKETPQEVTVKTGFGAIMRKVYDFPMPEFVGWEIDSIEKLEAAVRTFDSPFDARRYFNAGDNQIAGVGDGFERNTPPWINTVASLWPDFPTFGSIIEVNECMTRLIGPENHMLWVGMEPERMADVVARVGQFYLDCAKAQIDAAAGKLDGFVIWGDIAYKCGTFMHPDFWREHYKPWVKAITDHAHSKGLMVIYHGCGNVHAVIRDFAEMGIEAYNPLEVKAGMDAVELRRELGHSLGFCGNSDIQIWEKGDPAAIRREVLRKLNAAKGGGYIFQSDHSVASNVSGKTYDMIVKLVREYGQYPLRLGDFDEAVNGVSPKSEEIKAYNLDFNWGEGGPNAFAAPGLWADASPEAHIKWYKDMGVNTIQTFIVSCNGYAWYKNGVVPEQPGLKHDFLPEMVRLGHKEGLKVMGYLCIGSNVRWGLENPDYSYGIPADRHIPFTQKYLVYLDALIRDAIPKTGIDGFMIDWFYQPNRASHNGKWLESEKQRFAELMGKPFPGEEDLSEEVYDQYARKSIEACWDVIYKAAKETDPNCILWLTCLDITHAHIINSKMFHEIDWLMNEEGDVAKIDAIKSMVGKNTRLITCLADWNKKDAKVVVADAAKNGVGLYGFVKPDSTSLLPPVGHFLSQPVDSFTCDDRNIATLARVYNNLPIDYVQK